MLVFGLEVFGTILNLCTLICGVYMSRVVVASDWWDGTMGLEWGIEINSVTVPPKIPPVRRTSLRQL